MVTGLIVQATIVHCCVQQLQILAILIAVQDITHILQILLNGFVNHALALVFRSICCIHHFDSDGLVPVFNALQLVD